MRNSIVKKQQQVKEIVELIDKSKSFLLFEYKGLSAPRITELRKKLYANGSMMKVLKNNILQRAFENSYVKEDKMYDEYIKALTGPNAILFAFDDEMSIFKDLDEIAKEFEFINIKGGCFNKEFVDKAKIKAIASIPGREGLYSMLLSCLTAPIRKVLYAFKAVADQKQ